MKRLTRREVQEGLKTVPIERILIGGAETKQTRLTPKQIKFAEQIALGNSKAEAYRKSRDTKAKPVTASRRGQDLMKNSAIQAQAEAFKLALDAERLRTPAQLRALTIQKLTEGALSEDFPPAQRVKCLELLGKITEVSLFSERRTTVHIHDAENIKQKLLESLRSALKVNAIDAKLIEGDSLLREIQAGAEPIDSDGGEPHPSGTPQENFDGTQACIHTNPHTESIDESAHLLCDSEGASQEEQKDG